MDYLMKEIKELQMHQIYANLLGLRNSGLVKGEQLRNLERKIISLSYELYDIQVDYKFENNASAEVLGVEELPNNVLR